MFGDADPGARDDQRDSRRDVERPRSIAAGPARIEHILEPPRDRQRVGAHAARESDDLGRPLRYFWEPQRRGFIRTTLGAGNCDLVIGVPSRYELVDTTRPYYRSTYVFVTSTGRMPVLESLDDPRLRVLRVGVQITGEDYENPPPAQALALRGLAGNVRGFPVYGDYSKPAPQRSIVDAVADGRVDAALVWGPLAGYFVRRAAVPLTVTPVIPGTDRFGLPFTFEIAMGVRHGNARLREQVDAVIARRSREIRSILARFGVPLVEPVAQTTTHGQRVAKVGK